MNTQVGNCTYLMVIFFMLLAGGPAFGSTVYTNDFESGIAAEWSLSTLDSSVPDPFTTFSGRFGNTTQTLTVSNLTVSEEYSLFFDLYIIDSWDAGGDLFHVDIAGNNYFSHSFHYNVSGQSYPDDPDIGPYNYGFSGYNDSIYRNVEVVFAAPSDVVPFSFYATGLSDLGDESWGIDNVRVQPMSATKISGTSLPTGTTTEAFEWFTVTSMRNLSTATATNAASYDLRGAGLDGSFDTADDALYTLTPSFSGGKTVTLTIENNVPLQSGNYRFVTTANLQDSLNDAVELYSHTFTISESSNIQIEDLDNDSQGTADNLNPLETPAGSGFLTATAYGTFSSSLDDDYWFFYAETGDRITAFVQVSRSDVNPYIRLRNASGSQLSGPNNWTDFTRLQDYVISEGGTYYLQLDPYYERQPPASYTLRLDIARGRGMETEDNNNTGQADLLSWGVDGSALKNEMTGALEKNADYFNLGYLSSGNAMSFNVRFPDGSTLNSGNVNFEVQTADGSALLSTNTPLFAYDVSSNAVLYLKVDSSEYDTLSQYIVDSVILDNGVPEITGDSLPAEGSTNTVIIDRFSVDVSEYMDVASITDSASWQMISAGADSIFGNGDDEVYSLAPDYSANSLSVSIAITDGPLQPDRNYRFTATTDLTDRVGNPISDPYVREFRLENIPLFIHENRNNDSVATATPLGAVTNLADGTVSHLQTVSVGDNPIDVISADLNGDLHPDLITCNLYSDNITILSGDQFGSFSVVTNIAAGDGPRQAALGHFNGDAFLDLAVANDYADSIMIFLGKSDGTFQSPTTLAADDAPYDIKVGDLDGDDAVDLAVIHYYSHTLKIYKGDGAGNFSSYTNLPTGTQPTELSLAYLDGDTHLDVAVANQASDDVTVYLNNGDGTFAAPVTYPAGDGPRCIKVGDVDNDGRQDLVVGNYNADSVSVFIGNGDGTFAAVTNYAGCDGPVDVELVDLDSDGIKDIVTASYAGNRLNFFENQGDGTFAFSDHAFTINYYPHSIAVADFTGDTLEDLALVNSYYDQVYTYGGNAAVVLAEDPSGSGLCYGFGRGNREDSSDYDCWAFSGEAGDKVRIAIEVPGNPGNSGHYYELMSHEGTVLGGYYSSGNGYGQSPPITLPSSGRYVMRVRHWYNYWSEYRIRVVKVPAAMQLESESNNGTGEADLLSFDPVGGGRLGATVAGCIDTVDTAGDFFSLGNLTAGTVVNVSITKPSHSPLSSEIGMLDAEGDLVAFTSNLVLRLGGTAADYGICNPITNFPTTAFTAEFWMKSDDTSKSGSAVSYAISSSYNNEMLLYDYRGFDPHVGNSSYATGVSGNNGRWNHIAWTWDSVTGTSLFYKNGELVHSNGNWRTAYNITQNGSFVVGLDQDDVGGAFSDSEAFLGEIDELRIWNVVRSPAEIQSAMDASIGGDEAGLIGCWNFEDGTADDLTVNANDLTLFGNSQIVESDRTGSTSWPTNFQYTTTSGVYHVRVRDAQAQGCLTHQYLLSVSLQDGSVPYVVANTLPAEGADSESVIDRFSLTFSEEMDANSISNAANYELRSAGSDGVLDTGDDEIYTLLPTYSSGLEASYIVSDGPLQPGAVRFTATTGLLDRAGLAMSADYVRTFSITSPSGFIMENRNNGSIAAATSLGIAASGVSDGSLVDIGSLAVRQQSIRACYDQF